VSLTDTLRSRLAQPAFPRASAYDPARVLDSWMGPNPLWLAEGLTNVMRLEAGMRVLDLGCGKAASSIFLAKEFGATVWAADLWVTPSENFRRIEAAGLAGRVLPIHAEAHALPFAEGYFDAIVSFDAYHYFGTDDLYLAYLAKFLRPGGRLGIVVPGLVEELADEPPPWLKPYWEPAFHSFHSPAWWRRHWARSGAVAIEVADNLPDGWRLWAEWNKVCAEAGVGLEKGKVAAREAAMLRADAGRTLAFTRMVARRQE
jgi:cyclopropane fatty-acyl-phospholipid synthase-like methyltransferase